MARCTHPFARVCRLTALSLDSYLIMMADWTSEEEGGGATVCSPKSTEAVVGCRARRGLWRSVKTPSLCRAQLHQSARLNLPLAALLYQHTPGLNKVCQAALHLASTLFTSVMMVQPLLASKAPSRRHVDQPKARVLRKFFFQSRCHAGGTLACGGGSRVATTLRSPKK